MKTYGKKVSALKEWAPLDGLLQDGFYVVAREHETDLLSDRYEVLDSAWSRLQPWPDAVSGFEKLRRKFTLAALTNANIEMLESLSKTLPWDVLLSAELVHKYKPDPEIYQMALDNLALPASEVCMVASHTFDLNAAHKLGFKTALIQREGEPGSDPKGLNHTAIIANSIEKLAEFLFILDCHD